LLVKQKKVTLPKKPKNINKIKKAKLSDNYAKNLERKMVAEIIEHQLTQVFEIHFGILKHNK